MKKIIVLASVLCLSSAFAYTDCGSAHQLNEKNTIANFQAGMKKKNLSAEATQLLNDGLIIQISEKYDYACADQAEGLKKINRISDELFN
jgi:hypothetical protein